MTGDVRPVMPLAGPLDAEPQMPMWQALQQLSAALDGLPMGPWDAQVQLWLAEKDAGTVATIASLLRRSWAVGVEDGRAERVDEQPAVIELRAHLSDQEAEVQRAHGVEREDGDTIADLAAERDRAEALRDTLRAERDRLRAVLDAVLEKVAAFAALAEVGAQPTGRQLLADVDGAIGGAL